MIWSAFILGLVGSFHCIVMCGPIAIATAGGKRDRLYNGKILAYNIGRTTTYFVLGLIAGSLGFVASLAGLQHLLSLVLGSFIVLAVIVSYLTRRHLTGSKAYKLVSLIKRPFQNVLKKQTLGSKLFLGLINGLLPCGLVYVALAAAMAQNSIIHSGTYMMIFGLGTIPVMASLSFSAEYINRLKGIKINKLIPYLSLTMGLLLIVRGLALGIPYLSPDIKIEDNKPMSSCCKHKK